MKPITKWSNQTNPPRGTIKPHPLYPDVTTPLKCSSRGRPRLCQQPPLAFHKLLITTMASLHSPMAASSSPLVALNIPAVALNIPPVALNTLAVALITPVVALNSLAVASSSPYIKSLRIPSAQFRGQN